MNNVNDGFLLSIFTSTHQIFADKVRSINVRAYNGRIGLLPNHIAFSSVILPCEFIIENMDGEKHNGAILNGIIFYNKKETIIITEDAKFINEINKSDVETKINNYKKELSENKDLTEKEIKRLKDKIFYYQIQLDIFIEQI